ncbi:MAG: FAD-dependent oxidoreductase [Candidatus Aureabacteria bacterium]|nr:FAD-dependent oxidoreductase [Candidatus Auribacterota bacterium]
MPEWRVKFIERIPRTPDIESFRFEPEEKIIYAAGQFVQVLFDETNKNNRELNKYLSLSCAPGKTHVEITKRRSNSAFCDRLWSMEKGKTVLLKGPMGHCLLNETNWKIAFLTGGIGITPVVSMLEFIMDNKLPADVWLLYSNRTEKDIAFRNELDAWSRLNHHIKVAYTVVDCPPKNTACFSGIINENFILQKVPDYLERIIYIFGPPGMVTSMKNLCSGIKCHPEKIKIENFTGY